MVELPVDVDSESLLPDELGPSPLQSFAGAVQGTLVSCTLTDWGDFAQIVTISFSGGHQH